MSNLDQQVRFVRVFAAGPDGGNPAPIVVDAAGMSDAQMQEVASTYGHESGFVLPPPPGSIILMTAPIILPPLRAANFDIIWFGVVMTIVMEMGLIHPPVGLNIFVIRNVAPDIPLREVIWGTLPFVLLMMFAVLLLCFVPGISTWLPDLVMGPDGSR